MERLSPDEKKRGIGSSMPLFILSMIIFGTIGVFRRAIPLPSDVLAFGRGVMGSLFLLLVLRIRGRRFSVSQIGRRQFFLLILTGALIGFNWILLFEAYNYTTVAAATLCYYMQPVILLLLSPFVLKEHLRRKQAVCAVFSALGMFLVSGVLGAAPAAAGNSTGILLGLGAAVLYAFVVLCNKRIANIPLYEKTILQLLSAALVMIPYMAATGSLKLYPLTGTAILLFLAVGIIHTGIAYALYFGAVEKLPARTCALFSYIDPVTAVLLSALFLQEPLTGAGIIGTVLIIGAAIVSEL